MVDRFLPLGQPCPRILIRPEDPQVVRQDFPEAAAELDCAWCADDLEQHPEAAKRVEYFSGLSRTEIEEPWVRFSG